MVVGFESTQATVAEAETLESCIVIISGIAESQLVIQIFTIPSTASGLCITSPCEYPILLQFFLQLYILFQHHILIIYCGDMHEKTIMHSKCKAKQ